MDVDKYMTELGRAARTASRKVAAAPTAARNNALLAARDALDGARAQLALANGEDLERGAASGLAAALMDRLELTPARIDAMLEGLRQVANLPDPVGAITDMNTMPSGIQVGRMRVPLGVIGIIYESRPNVTVEAASLCLKSGNATILRGGSEALASNCAIADCLAQGLAAAGLPQSAVQVVANATPKAVATAIAQQTMPQLTQQDPDLVGFWLTAATLGHLRAPDNLSISEFLDQNRAWLTAHTSTTDAASLRTGLGLFAAFSTERDPALAELAQTHHRLPPPENSAKGESAMDDQANKILRNSKTHACCQAVELAAAVIVLCPATPRENLAMDASMQAACAYTTNWLAETTGLATR